MAQPVIPTTERAGAQEQVAIPTPESPPTPEINENQIGTPVAEGQKTSVPLKPNSDQPTVTNSRGESTSPTDNPPSPETEKEAEKGPATSARTWRRVYEFFRRHLVKLLEKK